MSENPYSRPAAEVASRTSTFDLEVGEARARPALRGGTWVFQACRLFLRRPFSWIGVAFVTWFLLTTMNLVLVVIPLIGSLVPILLAPVFGAGLLHIAYTHEQYGQIDLGDIFAGFRYQTAPLIGLGGLLIAMMVAVFVITLVSVFAVFGADILAAAAAAQESEQALEQAASQGAVIKVAIVFIVMTTVSAVVLAMYWFSPALVYFGGREPLTALGQSLRAFLRNILPSFIYGLVLILFWFLLTVVSLVLMAGSMGFGSSMVSAESVEGFLSGFGVLTLFGVVVFFVGYFAFMAVAAISVYTAFRDIFVVESASE